MDFASMDRRQLTMGGSGLSVMLTLHFTFQLLSQHLFYWKNPKEQKAIIIIILMAPLYAVVSFVGLLDIQGSKPLFMLLDSVKECYEALVCALFTYFILSLSLLIILWFNSKVGLCFPALGQAIAKFLALMYSYLNISMSKNVVPDEIKGREIHHSFPMTLFQVRLCYVV